MKPACLAQLHILYARAKTDIIVDARESAGTCPDAGGNDDIELGY